MRMRAPASARPGPGRERPPSAAAGAPPEGSGCGSVCGGWAAPGGEEAGEEGRPAGPGAPQACRSGGEAVPGLTCLRASSGPREASAQGGGFSYWLRDLNGVDTGRALGACGCSPGRSRAAQSGRERFKLGFLRALVAVTEVILY